MSAVPKTQMRAYRGEPYQSTHCAGTDAAACSCRWSDAAGRCIAAGCAAMQPLPLVRLGQLWGCSWVRIYARRSDSGRSHHTVARQGHVRRLWGSGSSPSHRCGCTVLSAAQCAQTQVWAGTGQEAAGLRGFSGNRLSGNGPSGNWLSGNGLSGDGTGGVEADGGSFGGEKGRRRVSVSRGPSTWTRGTGARLCQAEPFGALGRNCGRLKSTD